MKSTAPWPRVSYENITWTADTTPGISRRAALRARGPYEAAVPPRIQSLDIPPLGGESVLAADEAVVELSRFDAEVGMITAPFSAILLRTESAASSEIEHLTASAKSIALAALGKPSGVNARLVVGNVRAMEAAIDVADELDEATIIAMQAAILRDEQPEHVGSWRDQPVWIGGGPSGTPHSADFVPPHHERVPELMADLVAFARRTDLPALPQAAIVHAQFETIHPFPDGNGRTGRALLQAMLRRLGVTQNVTVPVSAGLLRDTAGYFDALTSYRLGDVGPIVRTVSEASSAAVVNGRILVTEIGDVRTRWEHEVSGRSGSAARRMLDVLEQQPVVNAALVAQRLGIAERNAQIGIDALVADGILQQIGTATRHRLYESPEVLAALDTFASRAKRRRP